MVDQGDDRIILTLEVSLRPRAFRSPLSIASWAISSLRCDISIAPREQSQRRRRADPSLRIRWQLPFD